MGPYVTGERFETVPFKFVRDLVVVAYRVFSFFQIFFVQRPFVLSKFNCILVAAFVLFAAFVQQFLDALLLLFLNIPKSRLPIQLALLPFNLDGV